MMLNLLVVLLLQIGNFSNFDIIQFMVETPEPGSRLHYSITNDIIKSYKCPVTSIPLIINDAKCCCKKSEFYDNSDRFMELLKQFQERYGSDLSLSSIAISNFKHDYHYSPSIFQIVRSNDNKHGLICYISEKDSFKSDTLNLEEIALISKFFDSSENTLVFYNPNYNLEAPIINLYMKTINFQTNRTAIALFKGVTKFYLEDLKELNPLESDFYEIARLYNDFYKLLVDKTTDMRCKSVLSK